MSERLRELERKHRAAPDDLATLRALADERRRRGDEMLPDVRRGNPWDAIRAALNAAEIDRWLGRSPLGDAWLRPVVGDYGPGLAEALYPIFVRSRGAYAMHLPVMSITIQ